METTTKMQIVNIDHKEYGIEDSKATQIAEQFKPMLERMIELEKEFNEVVKIPVDDVSAQFKAKELRLKYVKVRTGTAEIHKQQKAFYLSAGRFIDGWKNAQLFASEGIEQRLQAFESHFDNLEKERIKKLTIERLSELQAFEFDGTSMNVGSMANDVWINFLSGTKLQFEAKKEAEAKAEYERIAKEKAEKAEQERIRLENERLKAEAIEKEKALAKEREKAEKERLAIEALRKAEQDKADKILEAQRKGSADKLAKEQAIANAKLKAEQEESARLKAELLAKQKAEQDAEDKRLAEIKAKDIADKKAKKAPDKIKIKASIDNLPMLECDVTSDEGQAVFNEIRSKYEAFKEWASNKANTL